MDLQFKEISELRELLDSKQISSVELTQSFLKRIKDIDPSLNSYITVTETEALAAARKADDFIASPGDNPVLCGIPFANKDLFCAKDIRTTAASKMLDQYVPPFNSTVLAKLDEQYAVHLGKTNLDEFAHGSSTETSAYGPSKNPWDTTRNPGGSSGGSAAAVAAGLAPWGTATETGGSIRQPASLNGISGWKPTYGRVSRFGVIAMASSLDSPGAVAYSVKDLAMIAEVISGHDPKDSTTGNVPVPNYYNSLRTDLKGLKVGVPQEYFVDGMEPGLAEKVQDAIKVLEAQGAEIVPVTLPNTKYGSLVYAIVCSSEVSSNLMRFDGIKYGYSSPNSKSLLEVYQKSRAEGFGQEAKRRIMIGAYVLSAGYFDAYYRKAQKVRRLILDEFAEVFKKVDILACPSTPNTAVPIGGAAENPLFGYIADQLNIPSSLAGLPGLSVPCGFIKPTTGANKEQVEMPVGLQLIGPQWGEQVVFDAGHVFQLNTDWHKKHPRI